MPYPRGPWRIWGPSGMLATFLSSQESSCYPIFLQQIQACLGKGRGLWLRVIANITSTLSSLPVPPRKEVQKKDTGSRARTMLALPDALASDSPD